MANTFVEILGQTKNMVSITVIAVSWTITTSTRLMSVDLSLLLGSGVARGDLVAHAVVLPGNAINLLLQVRHVTILRSKFLL